MKILHSISYLGVKSGGTSTCTYDLVKGLNSIGLDTTLLTLNIRSKDDKLIGNDSFIHVLDNDGLSPFIYSKNYKRYLTAHSEFDLYHINGFWQYPVHITSSIARRNNKPYIITPHGMLYPQSLSQKRWRKKAFMSILFLKDLESASCIHATCEEEMFHLRNLGIKTPIAIIPNAISNISNFPKPCITEFFKLGYLGRIHPRKNIERLIYAWNLLKNDIDKNAEFHIIGDGDEIYMNFLKSEVQRLSLKNIYFLGFLSGNDKIRALASCSCLGVVSDFENFGMIIPEALQMGVPVITSKGTPWQKLEDYNCGWWINNDVDTIYKTLVNVMKMPRQDLYEMGLAGKKMVEDNYSIDIVSYKMQQLYHWLLGLDEKPDFIY